MDKLLDEKAAALALHLQPRTLTRWRWGGKGPPYIKVCGAIRYSVSDLEDFIAENRISVS